MEESEEEENEEDSSGKESDNQVDNIAPVIQIEENSLPEEKSPKKIEIKLPGISSSNVAKEEKK